MKGILLRILIACFVLAAVNASFGVAHASTITLTHDEELSVIFAIAGYGGGNPADDPTSISLELAGFAPAGTATAAIPGSSQSYYSGILLQGSVQSTDGAVSLPLFDADSWRLGLPTGDMVADASSGGGATVYADVAVSLNLSQSLFGTSGQAEFVIQNLGSELTIGLGPGYSISNAILAPLSADNGAIDTAGYLVSEQTSSLPTLPGSQGTAVPEPAAIGVAAAGGAVIFWLRRRIRPN